MNKICTSIGQSKKLKELGIDVNSADMHWQYIEEDNGQLQWFHFPKDFSINENESIPAWSLAALLEQLDDEITDDNGNDYNLTIVKESLQYQLYYHDSWGQVEDIETNYYDDLVDACYEMIIKLGELKML